MIPPHRKAEALSGIPHGFFGRGGGVSRGLYDSLNCGAGSGDDPAAVAENRDRVRRALGADELVTAYQTHSATAFFVTEPFAGSPPQADALVTDRPGLALGALAADCMTVLFFEPEARLVGAAHAGWRGSLAGILEATIALIEEKGGKAGRILCAIGPCLRADAFEVGEDLVSEVTGRYPGAVRFFRPAPAAGKHLYDHAAFGRWRIEAAGVDPDRIDDVGGCTLTRPDRWFSYRASRKQCAPDYGRNISAIALSAA